MTSLDESPAFRADDAAFLAHDVLGRVRDSGTAFLPLKTAVGASTATDASARSQDRRNTDYSRVLVLVDALVLGLSGDA